MLSLENVDKSFKGEKVLDRVSFDLDLGEVLSIIGPSGAGKSTIMRIINNLEYLDAGSIKLGQDYIYQAGRRKNVPELSKRLGLVFQNYNLFPHMNVLENIRVSLVEVYGLDLDQANKEAREALGRVKLLDKETSYPYELSGGERQRVAIARAYVLKPSIICLDEPTSALDPESIGHIENLIGSLKEENIGILIISHDMNFAKKVSDRILFLEKGQLYNIDSDRVADFMGGN